MTALGEVVLDAQTGFACGREDADGIFQFRMNNITNASSLDLSKRRRVPADAHKKISSFLVAKDDVLFNATNSPDNVGKSVLVPGLDEKAVFSNHFIRLRTDKERLVPSYLWRWLQWNFQRGLFGSMCRQWVNQATVSREALLGLEVSLPPLDEQRRIAAILDQLDSLRGMRLNVITALDDLVRSLFSEASGAGPSTVMPLPDAYWFQEGPGIRKWQFTDTGVKLLNVGNITVDGRLDLSKTERHVSADEANGRYKHFLVDPGDLVIASSGISFDADGLLRTRGAFVDEVDLPLCMNTSTIRFKAKTGLSHLTYLRSWLNSAEFRSQISRLVTGSAQQNFGPSHLKQMQITLPPVSIQERFAQQVRAIERHRTRCLEMLTQSDQMTASIQSDAFTGSI